MADEPTNPQQAIDDASKKLEAGPVVDIPSPPTQPETVIISPKDQKPESPPQIPKQQKKKSGKGMLIGTLLFLILTLPVAVYYGSQQYQQILEMRGRAVGPYPTCPPYDPRLSPNCGCGEAFCGGCISACRHITNKTCQQLIDEECGVVVGCGGRTAEGTWHGCDYLNNTGNTGPAGSGCDSSNCGGQDCGCFTYKCGVYCLKNSCGADACYTNTPGTTPTSGPTNTPRPTATNTPAATNTPGPTATPTIGNTSAPGTCDASCDTDSNCESGLSCYSVTGVKRCRKVTCPDRSNCECPIAQTTATPTERVIAEAPVATATQIPTPKVPVSGAIDVKAIIITVGSVLLLALGLIL